MPSAWCLPSHGLTPHQRDPARRKKVKHGVQSRVPCSWGEGADDGQGVVAGNPRLGTPSRREPGQRLRAGLGRHSHLDSDCLGSKVGPCLGGAQVTFWGDGIIHHLNCSLGSQELACQTSHLGTKVCAFHCVSITPPREEREQELPLGTGNCVPYFPTGPLEKTMSPGNAADIFKDSTQWLSEHLLGRPYSGWGSED